MPQPSQPAAPTQPPLGLNLEVLFSCPSSFLHHPALLPSDLPRSPSSVLGLGPAGCSVGSRQGHWKRQPCVVLQGIISGAQGHRPQEPHLLCLQPSCSCLFPLGQQSGPASRALRPGHAQPGRTNPLDKRENQAGEDGFPPCSSPTRPQGPPPSEIE